MTFPLVRAAATAQYRILVADDTPTTRSLFQSYPAAEILVRGVLGDRHELIRAISKSAELDAVLCNDHLSGMYGGVQALNELRASGALPHATAFILMSGDARKSNLMASLEARPDGILLKPFAPGALIRKLEGVIHARRALAPLRELEAQQNWAELLQVANSMLDKGTRYHAAVDQLKLEAAERLGNPDAVLTSYHLMLAKNPDSPGVLEALARLAYQQGYFDEAESALTRLLVLQPENVQASALLVDVLLSRFDPAGAQRQLQLVVLQSPNNVARHRMLGHLALLNGDTLTAQRAYLVAMRQHAEAHGLDDVDVVNAARALILHGDTHHAWQVVTDARKTLPGSLMLDVLERLVDTVMHRTYNSYSTTQQRLTEAIVLLDRPVLKDVGALKLAAVEACMSALLVHRAFVLSKDLVNPVPDMKLHPLQMEWAGKLNTWAVAADGVELPKGLQHLHKFMR